MLQTTTETKDETTIRRRDWWDLNPGPRCLWPTSLPVQPRGSLHITLASYRILLYDHFISLTAPENNTQQADETKTKHPVRLPASESKCKLVECCSGFFKLVVFIMWLHVYWLFPEWARQSPREIQLSKRYLGVKEERGWSIKA